jgi:hypothetical protein
VKSLVVEVGGQREHRGLHEPRLYVGRRAIKP